MFPVRLVPRDFITPIHPVDFANDDGYDCDMLDDFLRAFCLQTRQDAQFMTLMADELRSGEDPKLIAEKLEYWARTLDNYNTEFRRAMNNPVLQASYFTEDEPA